VEQCGGAAERSLESPLGANSPNILIKIKRKRSLILMMRSKGNYAFVVLSMGTHKSFVLWSLT